MILLTTRQVCAKLNISRRTLGYRRKDPQSNFPVPVLTQFKDQYNEDDINNYIYYLIEQERQAA